MTAFDLATEYQRILACCREQDAPSAMIAQSEDFVAGRWRTYEYTLNSIAMEMTDKTVLDLGCKCGHSLLLFLARGAKEIIGAEVEDAYLSGARIIEKMYPQVRFVETQHGHIPLRPDTVDLVFINEVISHVNPAFLDAMYADVARVLKPGGMVFISDGNNIANEKCREALVDLYDKWENGPDGTKTDRDVVVKSFLTRRRELIRQRHPHIADGEVEYLARNTSGLFGDRLCAAVDRYLATGELVERPYRRGICPTNPGPSGVVMERGFHPAQVESALAEYGIEAHQNFPESSSAAVNTNEHRHSILARLRAWLSRCRAHFDTKSKDASRSAVTLEERRAESWNFQIVGTKKT